MVVVPQMGEQAIIGRRVAQLGAGILPDERRSHRSRAAGIGAAPADRRQLPSAGRYHPPLLPRRRRHAARPRRFARSRGNRGHFCSQSLRSASYCITNRFVIEPASCRLDVPSRPPHELEILRVLWRRGPSTVHEIQPEIARGSRVGYTTVLKRAADRMYRKGLVTRNDASRPHVFKAAWRKAGQKARCSRNCSIRCSTARR